MIYRRLRMYRYPPERRNRISVIRPTLVSARYYTLRTSYTSYPLLHVQRKNLQCTNMFILGSGDCGNSIKMIIPKNHNIRLDDVMPTGALKQWARVYYINHFTAAAETLWFLSNLLQGASLICNSSRRDGGEQTTVYREIPVPMKFRIN